MRRLSIAQKIAAGYLLVSLFCLSAVVYALSALSHQTQLNQDLVRVDFATLRNKLVGQVEQFLRGHEQAMDQQLEQKHAQARQELENERQLNSALTGRLQELETNLEKFKQILIETEQYSP